jgi:hypothetical protein
VRRTENLNAYNEGTGAAVKGEKEHKKLSNKITE